MENDDRRLRESEEKFQKAFQASAAAMSITRLSDATYLDVNNAFTEMVGYSREEIIGRTSVDLGLIVNMAKREEVLRQVKEQGFVRSFEMTVQNKAGKKFEILSSIETIILGGEKYAINILYDITDRKKMEEELAQANGELEAFSYTVAHDLRAPLRAIDGYTQILGEEYAQAIDDEGRRLLGVIRQNTAKMGILIDDLLSFSRLGRRTVAKTRLDMNDLAARAVADLERTSPHKAKIVLGKLQDAPGEYALISQVMANLLSNAVKYSSRKETPRVEISSQKKDSEIIYTVKDNGEGFDMQYAAKLFGVFERLHSDAEFEGTGVGLATVRRIVTKHGGRVWAEAERGRGAVFNFSLPTE